MFQINIVASTFKVKSLRVGIDPEYKKMQGEPENKQDKENVVVKIIEPSPTPPPPENRKPPLENRKPPPENKPKQPENRKRPPENKPRQPENKPQVPEK